MKREEAVAREEKREAMNEGSLPSVCIVALAATCLLSCTRPESRKGKGEPQARDAAGRAGATPDTKPRAEAPVGPPVTPDRPRTAESAPPAERQPDAKLAYRWFFSFGYGRNRQDLDEIKSLVATAAAHGLNGMVLSSFGLDSVTRWSQEDLALLEEIDAFCRERQIELVPTGFSVGYGGGALGHDRNFAAALPVSIALEARGGEAIPVVPDENLFRNGDLEEHENGRFKHYAFHDRPGAISFPDADVVSSGGASIRFESFHLDEHGHGRIMQKIPVRPRHSYRFTCKIKTQDLQPASGVQVLVLKENGTLASVRPKIQPTQDWTEIALDFVNFAEREIRVYAGIWRGKSGRFWLDDFKLHEYGSLADIVRRDGTPLELRSSDRPKAFVEGEDFEEVTNQPRLKRITLTPNTAIRKGEKLVLSCYKTTFVGHSWGRQISLCMSNPALYEYWEAQARRLYEILKYKKFLLSMDEIRNGGGCLSCRDRGVSMAEILGDCMTKQYAIFKGIDPEIEVFTWSDMLDPDHNAHDNYYGVVGDFTGSWRHVPGQLIMACWYHKIRDKSLKFFSEHGFRTFGAAYYDADDLQGCRDWLASLRKTRNATGIMYTSWRRKYELLGPFGDLVSGQ